MAWKLLWIAFLTITNHFGTISVDFEKVAFLRQLAENFGSGDKKGKEEHYSILKF